MVAVAEIETRQDRRAFLPNGIEVVGIETQELENGGSYLSGFHKTVDGPAFELRIGHQNHHIGVIPGEATMLGLLFEASGVYNPHVRQDDDIGCAGIATFPKTSTGTRSIGHAGRIKNRVKRSAIEDLAESYSRSVGLQQSHCFEGVGRVGQP